MLAEPGTDSPSLTRQSLLARLRDWQDQSGWREFFDTYWRLIYNVARKSGLDDQEAQEVVQNTFIYLSRRMTRFHYDRTRGSFKSWLRVVTRSRISVYRRSIEGRGGPVHRPMPPADGEAIDPIEEVADPAGDALDEVWRREWEENLLNAALQRVRARVSSRQLLVFRLATLGELPLAQVAKKLHMSLPQVYLTRHRVGKMLKAEVLRLRSETE